MVAFADIAPIRNPSGFDLDAAGNMTTVPDPSSLSDGLTCTYDAWNRLVEVEDDGQTLAEYAYDGLNRRVMKRVPVDGGSSSSSVSAQR